jgi:predicted AAA+ superfamily ATPase
VIDLAIALKTTDLLAEYPIISITVPRQSVKTTLAKILKPKIHMLA